VTASREAIWRQFGASIDMLEGAIRACPDDLWADRSQQPVFWRLAFRRGKCRATISSLTDAKAREVHDFRWGRVSFDELLIYNLRHVQHGAAQLNLVLRRAAGTAAPWVCRFREEGE
jgi:hypothetical protein